VGRKGNVLFSGDTCRPKELSKEDLEAGQDGSHINKNQINHEREVSLRRGRGEKRKLVFEKGKFAVRKISKRELRK